jgi:PAS domain S-box-containing protein
LHNLIVNAAPRLAEEDSMPTEGQVMVASHDHFLVGLSVLISILAAYSASDLSQRISVSRGWNWLIWLLGGAAANGISTWSMHYTAMLAFRLPVPVEYDWPLVVLSLLISIVGAGGALLILSRSAIRWPQVAAAGAIMGGLGISGAHYTGMASMRLQGVQHYSLALVALSIVLAIAISCLALALNFLFRDDGLRRALRNHGSALLRGMANPVMHFVAMAGATFTFSSIVPDLSNAVSIAPISIVGISIVPVMFFVVALSTSLVDRLQKERALLDELFEQSPLAVALMSEGTRIVRVNREFTRLFGYRAPEALGHRLAELIVPDELGAEKQGYAEQVARGGRLDVESVRRRKDGSRLNVAIVGVPVTVAGGQIEIYAIYLDITERKRSEDALRLSTVRLRALSRRLLEIQEDERRHLARELHDEFGQILASINLHLHAARGAGGEAVLAQLDESAALLKQAGEQVRLLAFELRPTMLDTLGLEATLRWLVEHHQQRTGCEAQLVGQLSGAPLSPETAIACFRVAQEALTNVVRHAAARHVWIELSQSESALELVVRDDGVGFDAARILAQAGRHGSLGLLGMAERAQLLGGNLDVESEPGRGTRIRLTVPLVPRSSDRPDQEE